MKGLGPAALQVMPNKVFGEAHQSTIFVTAFTCKVPIVSHTLTHEEKSFLVSVTIMLCVSSTEDNGVPLVFDKYPKHLA